MSQTFPIFLLLIVFGNGLSSAAATLIGNALGANNKTQITHLLEHILFLALLLVIILTPTLLALTPAILALTGDVTPIVQELSLAYIVPILSFSLVFLLSYTLNGILNAYGDTKTYSNALIIGAIVNLGLDPLLMLGW